MGRFSPATLSVGLPAGDLWAFIHTQSEIGVMFIIYPSGVRVPWHLSTQRFLALGPSGDTRPLTV